MWEPAGIHSLRVIKAIGWCVVYKNESGRYVQNEWSKGKTEGGKSLQPWSQYFSAGGGGGEAAGNRVEIKG